MSSPTQRFLRNLRSIAPDTRLLWTPQLDAVQHLEWPFTDAGGKLTAEAADVRSRLSRLGLGYSLAFDGSANWSTCPDSPLFTFGNATLDQPFSVVALANITDTANNRSLVFKDDGSAREWQFNVEGSDLLALRLYDSGTQTNIQAGFSTAIIQGSPQLFTATYDGRGGGTATSGIKFYQGTVDKTGTPTTNASYVAMGNKTCSLGIGTRSGTHDRFFQGGLSLIQVVGVALTPTQIGDIKRLVNNYFGLNL